MSGGLLAAQVGKQGAFFSSECGPFELAAGSSKRYLSDLYHNYIWLGFGSGSSGGPTLGHLNGPFGNMGYYDHSGVNYLNPPDVFPWTPEGYPLNYYTDEVLDSILSLSRFTSLVRWKDIRDPLRTPGTTPYRPMRVTMNEGGPKVTLSQIQNGDPLPDTAWLWSGASDGYVTVGWIVHDFAPDYSKPKWDDPLPTTISPPWVKVENLTQVAALELVWFDDHRGKLVGTRVPQTAPGTFNVQAPATEPGSPPYFGKSIAFLIQPVGWTPNPTFEELPNVGDRIGQIEVTNRTPEWNEEFQYAHAGSAIFRVTTEPDLDPQPPPPAPDVYICDWYFGPPGQEQLVPDAGRQVTRTGYTVSNPPGEPQRVRVNIKERATGNRVSGDIMFVIIIP